MDPINNGSYYLLKKYPITKIKVKTWKKLKALKYNKFIDNQLCYHLKPTDSPANRFYDQPKIHKCKVNNFTCVNLEKFTLVKPQTWSDIIVAYHSGMML